MNKQMYQGDVSIREIPAIPEEAKPCPGRTRLIDGEATGHHHSLTTATGVEVFELVPHLYLRVGGEGIAIDHQEHFPIHLDPGKCYQVGRQCEYRYGEASYVAD